MYKSLFVIFLGFIFLSSDRKTFHKRPEYIPDIGTIYSDENTTGAENAPVTLIAYINFECPYCALLDKEILPKLKAKFIDKGKLKLVYRIFPMSRDITSDAILTSELAACSASGNRFWETAHVLFDNQGKDVWKNYEQWSRLAGLGESMGFKFCFNFHKMRYRVLTDQQRCIFHNIKVTPTVFINTRKMEGIHPYEEYEQAILDILE